MTKIVLETNNLTKSYGSVNAVNGVNITAYEGEVFGFLGPNGAGKTTTLGMVLGLVHPSAGTVKILDETVTPNNINALRQVGSLLGAPAFVPYLSAWDNISLVARLTPGIKKERIAEVLELVGLSEAARRKVSKFSTGMKQRVGLAMALIHRPRFIILDEPTNGLDPAGMREIRQLIRSFVDNGTSVLLSSHLLNEVQQVCDRIAVLNKGRIVIQGRVTELLEGQKPTVAVTISETAESAQLLNSLPNVEEIRVNNGCLTVTGLDSQTIMNYLVQHNLIPTEMAVQKSDLEALFLNATADKKQ